jgi:ABC-type nickel/cobalt efflux system permease component RcnA
MQLCNRNHRSISVFIFALLALLLCSTSAYAHPLGNFTVSQYVRIEPGQEQVRLIYVVDMAEIPTHAERARIDADGDGELSPAERDAYSQQIAQQLAVGLELTIDGRRQSLRVQQVALTFPPGQAGLPTLRLVMHYASHQAPGDAAEIALHNANYADRLGWREIVVAPQDGVRLLDLDAPQHEVSRQLTAYPQELLTLPLDIRQTAFHIAVAATSTQPASHAVVAASMGATAPTGRAVDPFADLVAVSDASPWAVAVAMLAALGWGALHALSPGHGKTIVAAYLVGTRGTVRHAALLGVTTTITHTAGVFALGFVTLALSQFILPEQLYPWLSAASGALVVIIGAGLVRDRLRKGRHHIHGNDHPHSHIHGQDHGRPHSHDHSHLHDGHSHSHLPPETISWRGLLALGISGGLLPCPSALVLMLGAISLNRVGFGLLLIVMFSIGLASVLTAIGVAMVHASKWVARLPESGRVLKLAPVASAIFIVGAGLMITVQALAQTGLFAQ